MKYVDLHNHLFENPLLDWDDEATTEEVTSNPWDDEPTLANDREPPEAA